MTDAPKFTPGPWQRTKFPDDWDFGGPGSGSFSSFCVGDADGAVLAAVYGEYPRLSAGVANASLIAAAPDLYAALAEMVETYREDGSDDDEQPVMVREALRALAKARA